MNKKDLDYRISQYNNVQIVTMLATLILLAILVVSGIGQNIYIYIGSLIVLLILGILHNIYYIRNIDAYRINKRRSYILPTIFLLEMIVVIAISFLIPVTQPLVAIFDVWTKFFISAAATFVIGLVSFSIPLFMQKKFLRLDEKQEALEGVKTRLDEKLAEVFDNILNPTRMNTKELNDGLRRVTEKLENADNALKGLFLVSYRDVINERTRTNYWELISPFIGPSVTIILFIIDKLIT